MNYEFYLKLAVKGQICRISDFKNDQNLWTIFSIVM